MNEETAIASGNSRASEDVEGMAAERTVHFRFQREWLK